MQLVKHLLGRSGDLSTNAAWKSSFVQNGCRVLFLFLFASLLYILDSGPSPSDVLTEPVHQAFLNAWDLSTYVESSATWVAFWMGLGSGLLAYLLAFAACHMNMAKGALAPPVLLSMLFTLTLLAVTPLCHAFLPSSTCSWDHDNVQYLVPAGLCLALGHALVFGWYLFRTDPVLLLQECVVYYVPGYNGVNLDTWLTLNRRQEVSVTQSGVSRRRSKPKVFICTTMYREEEDEMRQLLESIRHINEAQRGGDRNFESHIIFDNGVRQTELSDFALTLIALLEDTLGIEPKTCTKVTTPYGLKLSWGLPGPSGQQMAFNIHLKDNLLVKNKKRWSQVMYMSYVLDFLTEALQCGVETPCYNPPVWSGVSLLQPSRVEWRLPVTTLQCGVESPCYSPLVWSGVSLLQPSSVEWSLPVTTLQCGVSLLQPSSVEWILPVTTLQCGDFLLQHSSVEWRLPVTTLQCGVETPCYNPPVWSGDSLSQPSSGDSLLQPSSGDSLLQPSSGDSLSQPSSGNSLLQPSSVEWRLPVTTLQGRLPVTTLQWRLPVTTLQCGVETPCYNPPGWSGDSLLQPSSGDSLLQPSNVEWRLPVTALQCGVETPCYSPPVWSGDSLLQPSRVEWRLPPPPLSLCPADDEAYILTTDADVVFTPDSVEALLDLMTRDSSIGAVCARTHPMGGGPLVWYQVFEYAIGHWFQKTAEHALGSVLCAPGCFSVYRCRALADVLPKYAKRVETAFDFLTKDMGEDRWLCTLLVQSGWRIEYCAASENSTNCPGNFDEFYKQRRRWVASTLANLMLIVKEWKYVLLLNQRVSVIFLLYQGLLLFSTLIGPSTVMLVVSGYPDFSTSDVSPTVVSEPDVLATGPLAEGRFVDEQFGAGPLADGRFVDEHFGAGPLADVKCATPLYKILSSHISLAM
ncbi:hypothetical protein ACOMHN_033886 [Nucella lapillus]